MKPFYEIFLNGSRVVSFNDLYGQFLELFNNRELMMTLGIGTLADPFSETLVSGYFPGNPSFFVKSGESVQSVWEHSFDVHRGPSVILRAIKMSYLDGETLNDVSQTVLAQPVEIFDGDVATIRYSMQNSLLNQTAVSVQFVPVQEVNEVTSNFYFLNGPLPTIQDGQAYDFSELDVAEASDAFTVDYSYNGVNQTSDYMVNGPTVEGIQYGLLDTGHGVLYFHFPLPLNLGQSFTFSYTVGEQL